MSDNNRSKVTQESTMPTGGSRSERRARRDRPQRRQATEVIREKTVVTEVQVQGLGSHDHDDRYPRIGGRGEFSSVHAEDAIFGNSLAIRFTIRGRNLDITGNKNALIPGTEYGDLRFAATESDRARFWCYVNAYEDDAPADILARLPGEFTSVTQAPYWIAFETGYQLDGTELGTWARVTADVRDDLGPQQTPYGKRED